MNGIFSGAPCPSSIRLLVGTHLLMILQSSLVLWSAPDLGGSQARVDRYEHEVGGGRGVARRHEARSVGREHRDAVARLDAGCGQP